MVGEIDSDPDCKPQAAMRVLAGFEQDAADLAPTDQNVIGPFQTDPFGIDDAGAHIANRQCGGERQLRRARRITIKPVEPGGEEISGSDAQGRPRRPRPLLWRRATIHWGPVAPARA